MELIKGTFGSLSEDAIVNVIQDQVYEALSSCEPLKLIDDRPRRSKWYEVDVGSDQKLRLNVCSAIDREEHTRALVRRFGKV